MPHVRNSRANVDAWPSPTQTVFGSELRVDRTGAGTTTRSRPSSMDKAYLQERQSRKKPQRRRDEEYGVWNIRHYGLYNPSLYIGKRHDGKRHIMASVARVGR